MRVEERLPHLIPHLTDDQLMETYVLASAESTEKEDRHLVACGPCKARFDELAGVLDQMRADAVREADTIFTGERLHDQRDRILRRLERLGHPAEVLLFPSRASQHPVVQRVLGPARRWIAAAAAAGLAAGLFLGFAMDRRVMLATAGHDRMLQAPVNADAMAWSRLANDSRDDQILTEIEDALTGPRRVLELRALDIMTTPPELQEASFDFR